MKKNHWIVYNKDSGNIDVFSKFNCEEDEIWDSIIYFENNLE